MHDTTIFEEAAIVKMRVGVEILTGRFFYVEVEDDATLERLKREIAEKESFEEHRLVLMLKDGRLIRDDQRALGEYGIRDGSVVYLFFTSVGSPKWITLFDDVVSFDIREA